MSQYFDNDNNVKHNKKIIEFYFNDKKYNNYLFKLILIANIGRFDVSCITYDFFLSKFNRKYETKDAFYHAHVSACAWHCYWLFLILIIKKIL